MQSSPLNEQNIQNSDITPDKYQQLMIERQQLIEQTHNAAVSTNSQIPQTPQASPQNKTQDNPFSVDQYNNVQVPDMPVNYGGSMAESLLNDNEVPDKIKEKYWFVFHKDNILTFLDEDRKKSKMLNLDIAKIDELHTMPYYDYTFEKEFEFNIIRNVFETKLDRALGINGGNIKNERLVLQSQFSEQRQISENSNDNHVREGFFKRLLGRR